MRPCKPKSDTGKRTTPRTIKPTRLWFRIPTISSTIAAISATMLITRIPMAGTDPAERSAT